MKQPAEHLAGPMQPRIAREQASAQTVLLGLVLLLLGLGIGAFWHYRATRAAHQEAAAVVVRLSDGTRAALKNLSSPVEIRFYSLMDPASTSEALRAYSARVGELVSAYQQEAAGRIALTRQGTPSDAAATAAVADGIKAFNREKGDACYLGIAVIQNGRKESLPELSPDWEPALEADLTRALLRVVSASLPATPSPAATALETAATEEVKQQLPDAAAVSLEDGKLLLREVSLQAFQAAAKEMEAQVKAAQQRFQQAQNGASAAEQQAAREQLQQVQAEQAAKLQQIAARGQAQVAAWERLKGATAPPATGGSPASGAVPKR